MELESDQLSTMMENIILSKSTTKVAKSNKSPNKQTIRENIILSHSTTKAKTNESKVTFIWMIEDFLSLATKEEDKENRGEVLPESDPIREEFSIKDSKNKEVTWQIRLLPIMKTWQKSIVITLYSYTNLFETNVSHVEVTISLINYLGEKDVSKTNEWDSISGWNNEVEYAYFAIEKTKLLKEKKLFLRNGTLRVRCDLRVKYSLDTLTKQLPPPFSTEILFKSQMYNDVTLCCGDSKFRVHKMILSSVSPVFEKMFANYTAKGQSDILNIQNFDASIMETLLHYIYGIETDLNTDVCIAFYYAADKFDLKDLKKYYSAALLKKLNVSNVFDIAAAAHNDDELFYAAKTFARQNSYLFMTKTYKDFEIKTPEIAARILEGFWKDFENLHDEN